MIEKNQLSNPGKRQYGAATVVISVALLMAVTIVVLFSAKVSVMEQRFSANDYRGKQAFEAAESGVEYAISRINHQTFFRMSDGGQYLQISWEGDEERRECSSLSPCPTPFPDGTNSTGLVEELYLPENGDLTTIRIRSIGLSDDKTAKREVTEFIKLVPLVSNPPPSPLTARGNVSLLESATITGSDPESGFPATAIWAGGDVLPDPPPATIKGSVESGPNNISGREPDEFFESFFQATRQQVQSQSTIITRIENNSTDYSAALADINGKAIWINALDGLGNPGSVVIDNVSVGIAAPVVLIINGFSSLAIKSDAKINGLVYVSGSGDNELHADITGLVIVEGDVMLGGNSTITYNQSIIDALKNVGSYTKVAGSWRDF